MTQKDSRKKSWMSRGTCKRIKDNNISGSAIQNWLEPIFYRHIRMPLQNYRSEMMVVLRISTVFFFASHSRHRSPFHFFFRLAKHLHSSKCRNFWRELQGVILINISASAGFLRPLISYKYKRVHDSICCAQCLFNAVEIFVSDAKMHSLEWRCEGSLKSQSNACSCCIVFRAPFPFIFFSPDCF